MELLHITCFFLSGMFLSQSSGQDDYYPPVAAAGRELSNQMDFLFRSLATIPGPPMGRGLYKQTNRINIDLIYFRQQIQRKVPRGDLYLAFTPVDMELNQLLDDLQGIEKWDPAVRMAARRAQSALHDVHFALSAGDVAPARQTQIESRQVQALLNRESDLESLAGIVLYDPDEFKGFNTDFVDLRKSLAELQRLQKKKASRDDVKQQFVQADKTWEKLVDRFKALRSDQVLQLREDFGQVDQIFGRMATVLGLQNRRAPLRTNFLP